MSKSRSRLPTDYGTPTTKRGWRILFAAQWSLVIVGLVILAIIVWRKQGDPAKEVLLPVAIIAVVIALVLGGVASVYLLGRVRSFFVRTNLPKSSVFTAQLSDSLIAVLRELNPSVRLSTPKNLTVTISADEQGLTFWGGLRRPQKIAILSWDEVEEIGVTERNNLGATIASLQFSRSGGLDGPNFSLVPPNLFRISAPSSTELGPLLNTLKELWSQRRKDG